MRTIHCRQQHSSSIAISPEYSLSCSTWLDMIISRSVARSTGRYVENLICSSQMLPLSNLESDVLCIVGAHKVARLRDNTHHCRFLVKLLSVVRWNWCSWPLETLYLEERHPSALKRLQLHTQDGSPRGLGPPIPIAWSNRSIEYDCCIKFRVCSRDTAQGPSGRLLKESFVG